HTRCSRDWSSDVCSSDLVYDWGGGPTIYVDADGRVGNFNRFFAAENPPVEVQILRAFADEVRPRWTLDLHEGFGASYCLYALVEIGSASCRERSSVLQFA